MTNSVKHRRTQHSISLQPTLISAGASANATSRWRDWIGLAASIGWITPLGALLLISAHLFNRRSGCLCGCCDGKP